MAALNKNIDDLILNMSLTELREMVHNSEPVSVVYKNHTDSESENDNFSQLDDYILNMAT